MQSFLNKLTFFFNFVSKLEDKHKTVFLVLKFWTILGIVFGVWAFFSSPSVFFKKLVPKNSRPRKDYCPLRNLICM